MQCFSIMFDYAEIAAFLRLQCDIKHMTLLVMKTGMLC